MTYIDANEEYSMKDSIISEKENYSIEDLVLVRTTDGFPFEKKVLTPEHSKVVLKDYPTTMKYVIFNLLKEKYGEEWEKYQELFKIEQIEKRHTIHFCINGLVVSHDYGEFNDRDFVIIDPLKYHLDDENLKSMRAEDTYFTDDIMLSDESAIMMTKEKYESIKDDPLYIDVLQNMNVFCYEGDQYLAISKVLNTLGYDSFVINNHGYRNGIYKDKPAGEMLQFLINYCNINNINMDRHFNSEDNFMDVNRILEDDIEIETQLLEEMCTTLGENASTIEKLKAGLGRAINSSEYEDNLKNIISRYGLENLAELINRYNISFESELAVEKAKTI